MKIVSLEDAFSCQNASEMSFGENYFNKAYTINTVYFWENPGITMTEIQRVLKPGGLFINTLFSADTLSGFSHTRFGYKGFDVEELEKIGKNAGFDVNVVPIMNGSAYCVLYIKTS